MQLFSTYELAHVFVSRFLYIPYVCVLKSLSQSRECEYDLLILVFVFK